MAGAPVGMHAGPPAVFSVGIRGSNVSEFHARSLFLAWQLLLPTIYSLFVLQTRTVFTLDNVRISIGVRLFASVLLAILAVAASGVVLLRQNVLASFGDYAVAIELDRLDE